MHSIWAVAVNTLRQALRMKVAVIFIVLLLVLLPVMGLTMTGDGTLKGRLQTFVSYGLSLTSLLLCLLTIVVAVYSLTSDIDKKQIYTVLTKPVHRFQLLLGKLLGIVLLDVALLVLFSGIIYVITIGLPKYLKADETELAKVKNEFFTARASLKPAEIDVSAEVRETYEKLLKTGQVPPEIMGNRRQRNNFITELAKEKMIEKSSAAVGRELIWRFEDVRPLEPDQSLFVRFKYEVSANPPDLQIFSRWFVGDDRQYPYRVKAFERKDLIRTFHEIEVPSHLLAADGYLAVGFLNDLLNDTVVIFPVGDGLEVLYKADTFTANFMRAVLLIFFRLIFLACLGILSATFLSLPVAMMLCLALFFTATISNFCLESFSSLSEGLNVVYSYTVENVIRLLPQFDKFNPVKFLVPARLLSWLLLAKAAGLIVCIKSLLMLLLALLIFRRKEIAAIKI